MKNSMLHSLYIALSISFILSIGKCLKLRKIVKNHETHSVIVLMRSKIFCFLPKGVAMTQVEELLKYAKNVIEFTQIFAASMPFIHFLGYFAPLCFQEKQTA